MTTNPYEPPPPVESTPPRDIGLIPQIRAVAALMIAQGILCAALSGFSLLSIIVMTASGNQIVPANQVGSLRVLYFGLAIVSGVPAVGYLIAGGMNFFYRGRNYGLTALWLGLLGIGTCYCGPTSVALLVYGLIVYFNPAVMAAFRHAAGGATVAETLEAAYAGRFSAATEKAGRP